MALLEKNASLLPSGITEVSGHFSSGDCVDVVCGGESIAKGLVLYSSLDLDQIKGLQSKQIMSVLGYSSAKAAIHKDDLIVLKTMSN